MTFSPPNARTDLSRSMSNRQQFVQQFSENDMVLKVRLARWRSPRANSATFAPPACRSSPILAGRHRASARLTFFFTFSWIFPFAGARETRRGRERVQAHRSCAHQAGPGGGEEQRQQAPRVHPKRDVRPPAAARPSAPRPASDGPTPLPLVSSRRDRLDKMVKSMESKQETKHKEIQELQKKLQTLAAQQ